MAQDYLNQDDLATRLNGTICKYKGVPYYIQTHGYDAQRTSYPNVNLYSLKGGVVKYERRVDHRDPDFDDSAPLLGYMNYNNQAYYLKRMPYRHANQGLKYTDVMSVPFAIDRHDTQWFQGDAIYNCILGIYPRMSSAVEQLETNGGSCALHRDVAIGLINHRQHGLHYRGRLVAIKRRNEWDYLDGRDANVIRKLIEKTGVLQ